MGAIKKLCELGELAQSENESLLVGVGNDQPARHYESLELELHWFGGLRAVQEVTKLVSKYKPLVVFLIETKRKNHKIEWLRSRWKIDRCFLVEGIGKGDGLAILWMEEAHVKVKSFSKYHINVRVGETEIGKARRFTGFYGDPNTSKRTKS